MTKKAFNAKVVLQLYINPDSYKVGLQTIAAASEIDPKFSNQEIEWFTKERGSLFLTDCLLNLMKLIKVLFFFFFRILRLIATPSGDVLLCYSFVLKYGAHVSAT